MGFSSRGIQAQWLWHTDLIALWHVDSSQTWDRIHVPCIGRWISTHCTTIDVLSWYFQDFLFAFLQFDYAVFEFILLSIHQTSWICRCYWLNICWILTEFIYWNLPPPCDHIRRWDIREIIRGRGDYEGDSSCTGLLSSWGSQDSLLRLCSPPCEDIERRWQSATQKRVLTRIPPCWHPDLTLAAPRIVTKFCHWWATRCWDLVRAAWTKTQGMAHLAPAVH